MNAITNAYTVNSLNQYKAVTNLLDLTGYKLQFDSDGNTTRIGDHSLYYDAENRLVSYMFGLNPSATDTVRSAFLYDHIGRRVKKMGQECKEKDMGGIGYFTYWYTNEVTAFVYDGWNLIYERVAHTNGTVDEIEYVWGLDLSGSRQGAGGVGGLLFEKRNGAIYIPCYDANGNITAYVDTNGTIRAYRQFDAFGNTIAKGGAMVDVLHFWYSTKYLDHDTGLYYYGYRYYSPMLHRWINRDPIGEEGGVNLHAFVGNNSVSWWDYLGMLTTEQYKEKIIWSGETRYSATYWKVVVPFPIPMRTTHYAAFPQALSGEAYNRLKNSNTPKDGFGASHLTINKLTVYAKPKTKIEYNEKNRMLYEPGIAILKKGVSADTKWEYPWSEGPMALNALIGMSSVGGPEFDTSPQSTIKKWSDFYLDVGSLGIYEIHRKIRTCEGEEIVLETLTFKLLNKDLK